VSDGPDDEYCAHVKAYRSHILALAPYRASVERLTGAWEEENREFGNALHVAIALERAGPLKEYLASDKPLSRWDRNGLVTFIEWLEKHIPPKPTLGRPERNPQTANKVERAERNAAWLVAFCQAAWRNEHGLERVPGNETNKLIDKAIKEAATAFDVSAELINKDNIRNALKSGRVVVRY
jgi:hypothetical protein